MVKKTQFWGENEDDDRLVVQILEGRKTATCTPKMWWRPEDRHPLGTLLAVHDLRDRYRCTIRINKVYETRFGDVDERVIRGECCRDREHFEAEHVRAWAAPMAREGVTLDADTPIVVEHFELVPDPT